MSVHFLFVLLGILELSLPETLVIGCTAALCQSVWKPQHQPQLANVVFNVLSMTSNARSPLGLRANSTEHLPPGRRVQVAFCILRPPPRRTSLSALGVQKDGRLAQSLASRISSTRTQHRES